jgi:predicted Zn-dependent peptidase
MSTRGAWAVGSRPGYCIWKESPMMRCSTRRALAFAAALLAVAVPAAAQHLDAKEYWLDNGMQVLMVERHDSPTIMTAIVARVGSANEVTGMTGVSHLFEHMMFKGSEIIGTQDINRDLEIMAEMDSVRALMRTEESTMRERQRRGEIEDMLSPEAKTPRYRELEAAYDSLVLAEREVIIKDQLNEIYSKNGSSFLNAMTSEDMTVYVVRIPKNKIELFMWMESDRFSHPVFREFYSERDVVREERRLGIESTPTGSIEEDFWAMFWKSSSYHWDVIGWASDLGSITREQAEHYFDIYYAPNNLTMILVGDLDPDQTIKLAKKYFERIPRGTTPPPDVVSVEEPQHGERLLVADAETNPQAQIWFHTVAWKHPDTYPLEVLAGVMSGKTGRLYKKLVDEKGIAKSSEEGGGRRFGPARLAVTATQDSKKYAGAFEITAEGMAGVRAEQLEEAMGEVIADLRANPVPPDELQKVKNQLRVDTIRFMDLMAGMGIMFRLSQDAGMGDWTEFNNGPAKCDLVTAEDVQRVANKYFLDDQRSVLLINSKAAPGGGEAEQGGEDPRFAQFAQMIKGMTDAAKLEQMTGMMSMRLEQTEDPEERSQIEKLLKLANDRINELKAAQGN